MKGLHFEDIEVGYGTRTVLRGIGAAALLPGTITALIGPNAAGKSTLMRAIAGLLPIKRGAIAVDGTRIEKLRLRPRAKYVRYVPQTYATSARLSVYDAVHVAARAAAPDEAPRDIRLAVAATLERTGTAPLADRMVCDLSGGQQQLVALAQGLVRPAPCCCSTSRPAPSICATSLKRCACCAMRQSATRSRSRSPCTIWRWPHATPIG